MLQTKMSDEMWDFIRIIGKAVTVLIETADLKMGNNQDCQGCPQISIINKEVRVMKYSRNTRGLLE